MAYVKGKKMTAQKANRAFMPNGFHKILAWIKYVHVLFVLQAVFSLIPELNAATKATTNTQQKKIFIVMLYPKESLVETGFKEYFKIMNRNVVFVEETINNDSKNIPHVIARIRAEKPDLVYIYGTLPSLGIIGTYDAINPLVHITDIPVVFTGLAEPVASKVVEGWGASGRNVTGLGLSVPMDTQLSVINLYMLANVDKIALIYSPAESQSLLVFKKIKDIGAAKGFQVIDLPIALKDGVPQESSIPDVVKRAKDANVSLVYFPSDAFIVRNIVALCKSLEEHKLPSFAYNEFMVQKPNTVLFGVFCSLYTLGQRTAVKADDILFKGVDVSTIPVEIAGPFSVIYREDTLKKIKIFPSLDFLELAQSMGESAKPDAKTPML